jgi:hypothetical protein
VAVGRRVPCPVNERSAEWGAGEVFAVEHKEAVVALLVLSGLSAVTGWGCKLLPGGGGGAGKATETADWDGKTMFECTGNDKMTLKGKNVSMPSGAPASAMLPLQMCELMVGAGHGCPMIEAAGNCQLEIVDCTLSAPTVLSAGGNANVVFKNSTVKGAIKKGGSAVVTGLASLAEEDKKAAAQAHLKEYAKSACSAVAECYKKSAAWGNISGRVAVPIGADGRATGARYENGTAPAAVRQCLIADGKTKVVAPFDGHPWLMTCDYAGTMTPGSQMMNYSPGFTVTK